MRKKKAVTFICIFLLATCFIPMVAQAASIGVKASKSTLKVGETVSVTVTFSQANIMGVDANFSYDASVLEYIGGGSTSGGGGNGKIVTYGDGSGSSLKATISFKALKEGSSSVSVSSSQIADADEKLYSAGGSTKITVGNGSPQPSSSKEPSASPTPTLSPAEKGIDVTIDGKPLKLWRALPGVAIPEGFSAGEGGYQSASIAVAVGAGGKLKLGYVTDEEGENGKFYVLTEGGETLYPYVSVAAKGRYTLLRPDKDAAVPEGYEETSLAIGEQNVKAWQSRGESKDGIYLVYAIDGEGVAGYYYYDAGDGNMMRYEGILRIIEAAMPAPPAEAPETDEPITTDIVPDEHRDTVWMIVLAVICVMLAGALIAVLSKKKKLCK